MAYGFIPPPWFVLPMNKSSFPRKGLFNLGKLNVFSRGVVWCLKACLRDNKCICLNIVLKPFSGFSLQVNKWEAIHATLMITREATPREAMIATPLEKVEPWCSGQYIGSLYQPERFRETEMRFLSFFKGSRDPILYSFVPSFRGSFFFNFSLQ